MDQPTWSPRDQSALGAAAMAGGVFGVSLALIGHLIGEGRAGSLWPWLLDYPYRFHAAPWFLAGAAMGALLAIGPKLLRGLYGAGGGGGAQRRAGEPR